MSTNNPEEKRSDESPVLELSSVRFGSRTEGALRLNQFTGKIFPRDFVRVTLESHHDPRDLASLILGLHQPESGKVYFQGNTWLSKDYSQHFQMRSRVGRVFAGPAWIQNLSVGENIRLSQLHQRSDRSTVQQSLDKLIERLAGDRKGVIQRALSRRPAVVEPATLKVCQLIRATYYRPRFLVLERPYRLLHDRIRREFLSLIAELRSEGTAVLWFADDGDELEAAADRSITSWTISNDILINDSVETNHE